MRDGGGDRAAVEEANALPGLDIIEFESSGTVVLTSVVVDITDSLVLRPGAAPMVTISRVNQGGLLRILQDGTSVTIEDLTFTNPSGIAVAIGAGPQVTFRRCLFDGNINPSGSLGGAAISVGGETTVDACTFRNNSSAITSGGAIFLGTNATLTIEDSIIEDNLAGNGGGIAVGSGTVTLLDTLIQRNEALGDGGGIYSQSRIEAEGVFIYESTSVEMGRWQPLCIHCGTHSLRAVHLRMGGASQNGFCTASHTASPPMIGIEIQSAVTQPGWRRNGNTIRVRTNHNPILIHAQTGIEPNIPSLAIRPKPATNRSARAIP